MFFEFRGPGDHFLGWIYSYEIRMRDWINVNDLEVLVFFDQDGRMESAVPSNVPELHEIR